MKENICDLIAKRVRFHRQDLGYSRRVLSLQTDISERYLAQLEAGDANISVLLLERIANALDTTLTDLVKPRKSPKLNKGLVDYFSKLDSDAQQSALEMLEGSGASGK